MTLLLPPVTPENLQFVIDQIAKAFPVGAEQIVNGAITTAKLDAGAVTPAKRSGGVALGSFQSHATTGNKGINGVGFTPKVVKFVVWLNATTLNGSSGVTIGYGVMDGFTQAAAFISLDPNAPVNLSTDWNTSYCVYAASRTNTNVYQATFVSMDADGFTINVGTADNSYKVFWEAYG